MCVSFLGQELAASYSLILCNTIRLYLSNNEGICQHFFKKKVFLGGQGEFSLSQRHERGIILQLSGQNG